MIEFVDVIEMHKKYPTTFEIPSKEMINKIKPGTFVKICHKNERFWVKIVEVKGNNLRGVVDNDLVFEHPFDFGDDISFEKRNVYCVIE